jgi:hypothetical protein
MVPQQVLSGPNFDYLELGKVIWACVECDDKPVRTGDTPPHCIRGHEMKLFAR